MIFDPENAAKGVSEFAAELRALNLRESTIQFKIDGITYTSTKLPARTGLELWPRVTALLGAGLLRLIVAGESELGMDKLAAALVVVSERAMRDGLVPLVLDLLARMQCGALRGGGQGQITPDVFDTHFAGEYGHLLKVCAFALAHNLRGPTYGAR